MINAALMLIDKITMIVRAYNDATIEMFNGVQMKVFWLVLFQWVIFLFIIIMKNIYNSRG